MIIFFYEDKDISGKYLIITKKLISIEEYFMKININKDTFAGDFMKNIYNAILEDLENVKKIYEKYYKEEYESIKDFICKKYLFDEKQLQDKIWNDIEIYDVYYGDLYNKCNYDLNDLILSKEIIEKLNKII